MYVAVAATRWHKLLQNVKTAPRCAGHAPGMSATRLPAPCATSHRRRFHACQAKGLKRQSASTAEIKKRISPAQLATNIASQPVLTPRVRSSAPSVGQRVHLFAQRAKSQVFDTLQRNVSHATGQNTRPRRLRETQQCCLEFGHARPTSNSVRP